MDRVKGKVAIVTGAANGIGKAISELLAEEGAWVLVADIEDAPGRETVSTIRAEGGQAEYCHADVSKQEDVQRAVAQAAAHNARIDILVNNAAYLDPDFHGVLESTDKEWRGCIEVALLGTQYFTKAALPYMIAQKRVLRLQPAQCPYQLAVSWADSDAPRGRSRRSALSVAVRPDDSGPRRRTTRGCLGCVVPGLR
jgi:NAD(P)-dependent dehydrogenase (short-subunit alcohol dehydrogenase family)